MLPPPLLLPHPWRAGLLQVLAAKQEAKLKLQAAYSLAVGDDYTLAVFVGRVTHQKGCDIIAEVRVYACFSGGGGHASRIT